MKSNKAPKKLYFGESDKGILDIYSTKESDNEVEYTRTDAFIEKVLDFFENDLCYYIKAQDFTIEHERLETDFKIYIKGD